MGFATARTIALSGATGALAYPRVAMARVMLWARVKEVMVLRSIRQSATISKRPSTKSRWSIPNRMCSMPRRRYMRDLCQPVVLAPRVTDGLTGLSR